MNDKIDYVEPLKKFLWPNKYATASREHLEALGVISLNFNVYEHSLLIFLEESLLKEVAGFLFHKLNNEDRAKLIRLLMKDDPQLGDEIEYLLAHFSTCAENRHNLLHSRMVAPHGDILALEKFARKEPGKILEFQLKVGDLRRTADEMYAGFEFVFNLWHFMERRRKYHLDLAISLDGSMPPPDPATLPLLPKRPRAPRKINPNQSIGSA
jgi:hypothetical protein